MSVTIIAVRRSPSQVPQAAAFIKLEKKPAISIWELIAVVLGYVSDKFQPVSLLNGAQKASTDLLV